MRRRNLRNVERVLRNSAPPSWAGDPRAIAEFVARLDEALCRSFPVRRLSAGEASAHRSGTGIVWWERREWVRRGAEMPEFLSDVRREVADGALAFRLSPTVSFVSGRGPVLWLEGYVIPRSLAPKVGMSFNREMRTGRRAWWR